jgi:hypothetical protein
MANESAIASMKDKMRKQMKVLQSDAELIMRCMENAGSVKFMVEKLKKSIDLLNSNPAFVHELFHYQIPAVNEDVTIDRLEVRVISVKGWTGKSPIRVRFTPAWNKDQPLVTPALDGPYFQFDYRFKEKIVLPAMSRKKSGEMEKGGLKGSNARSEVSILAESGDEVYATQQFSLQNLWYQKDLQLLVNMPRPSTVAVKLEFRVYRALFKVQHFLASHDLLLSPFCAYIVPPRPAAPDSAKAPASGGATGGATGGAPGGATGGPHPGLRSVAPVAAAGGDGGHVEKTGREVKHVIIQPKKDWDGLFWPVTVIEHWKTCAGIALSTCKAYKKQPQKGLEEWYDWLTKKFGKFEEDQKSGKLNLEKYVAQVKEALERERKKLDGKFGAELEEQKMIVGLTNSELNDLTNN